MTTALRFSSSSSRAFGGRRSNSRCSLLLFSSKQFQKQFRKRDVLASRARGRGRIDAHKAAKEDDFDASNGLRNRRRTTNKTDHEEEEEADRKQRQRMTTRDDDCNDYDDDAEDNNNNNNNNSKDDEFVLSTNFRPNNGTANDVEEEEEASIKERARKLKNRLEAEVLEEQRWKEALESDDISKRRIGRTYQRRVQTHDLVRAKSGSSRSSASRFATSAVARSTSSQNGRSRGCASEQLPPLKGRQQKAMTITGDFIRTAKPKTFATLKVVLDAVAERYEVDAEKTVWTKTLWKYVSQEWDFRYYEMNDDSEDTDDDDILQVIDIVNGRDAHELIELWAKRRKVFRGVKCSSNVKEAVINGDTIEEEEEKEEEENVETPENEQIIA